MLWFFWTEGSNHVGQLNEFFLPKNKNFSFETFVLIGEFNSFQFEISSSKALVSNTLPLKIWAPIFSVADYGLEADLFEALPQFLEELNKLNTIQK